MKTSYYNAKKGRIQIDGLLIEAGDDGVILLAGGDNPHIGAVTVGQTGMFQQTTSFYNHKEEQICRKISENLQKEALIKCFVLTCGIHVNEITAQEIDDVVEMCEEIFGEMQKYLTKRITS